MINRRLILKSAAAIPVFSIVGRAKAAPLNLRWGMSFVNSDPIAIWAKNAAEKISEKSNGEVTVEVYPDSQLGSDSDMLSQARGGAIDIYSPSPFTIASLVPSAATIGFPFVMKNSSDVEKMSSSAVMEVVDADFQKVGLKSISSLWTSGIRHITNNRGPIERPEDLAGVKIRVPTSPIMVSLFQELGAAPVAMNVSELYLALQTGLVDAQENPLVVISSRKFQEVQKFCSMTGHVFGTSFQVMNAGRWASIPSDAQSLIMAELNAAASAQRKEADAIDDRLKGELSQAGMQFNTPDAELFRAQLIERKFYDKAKATVGADVFDKVEQTFGKLS